MEAVWKLEDKWKLSTKQALFFLLFAASGVAAICIAAAATKTALVRRWARSHKSMIAMEDKQQQEDEEEDEKRSKGSCGWGGIKTALMGSVRWSRPSKWAAGAGPTARRETPLPLLEKRLSSWPSRSSDSPVWQRPILMGEKCELPRFSGLILYDENGHLLCDVSPTETSHQVRVFFFWVVSQICESCSEQE